MTYKLEDKKKEVTLSFIVSKDVSKWITKRAKRSNVTKSVVIRKCIEESMIKEQNSDFKLF